jgi:hypothetical protein
LLACTPQGSDYADIFGHAFVDFESVPQVLVSFHRFAAQLPWSEEFEMASLASRQKWSLAHVFKNQESSLKHDDSLLPIGSSLQVRPNENKVYE